MSQNRKEWFQDHLNLREEERIKERSFFYRLQKFVKSIGFCLDRAFWQGFRYEDYKFGNFFATRKTISLRISWLLFGPRNNK